MANVLNVHMQKRSMMREEHEAIQAATGKMIASLREESKRQALDYGRLSSEVAKLRAKKP